MTPEENLYNLLVDVPDQDDDYWRNHRWRCEELTALSLHQISITLTRIFDLLLDQRK